MIKSIATLTRFLLLALIVISFTAARPTNNGIVFIDAKNKKGQEKTFNDIIGEFKGKVIYVDFWATWCLPCRNEMPYSKQLHETFKDNKNVVFLYITFDRTEDAWKNGVSKMDIQGFHWYPSDTQKFNINATYQVASIPRYMLIDKTGKVVNDNAQRPSSGEGIANAIKALL